jgi:hypothetical protein
MGEEARPEIAMRPLLLLLPLLLTGCDDRADDSAARDCPAVEAELAAAFAEAQRCSEASECGQPILGTSCGCTRNKVARLDADLSTVEALMAEGQAMSCELGLDSTCDCPDTGGFDCVEGSCAWLYTR